MTSYSAVLAKRRSASDVRLRALREKISSLLGQKDYFATHSSYDVDNLCIYATGSYGRGESSEESDIDLFMVDSAPEGETLGTVGKILIKADLIRICGELGFPEFDGEARYLEVHLLSEMVDAVGGPDDDAKNFFTGRLLLLLESQCVFNQANYESVLNEVIATYFRDFPKHQDDFLPAFLVNDVIRYWKTLCLSYEFKRKRAPGRNPGDQALGKLKNLKLSFSRLMTCFSALGALALVDRAGTTTPNDAMQIATQTPIERLQALVAKDEGLQALVDQTLEHYAWFLTALATHEAEALKWLEEKTNRIEADDHADQFRDAFHDLLLQAGAEGSLVKFITV